MQKPLVTLPPAPAMHVVARLTDVGTVSMSNTIGAGALEVEGVVAAANENEWKLQLLRVDHRDGKTVNWNRELVTFPSNLLTQPSVKMLDKKRSWIAAVGITVGAVLVARAFNVLGAEEEQDLGEQPANTVIPSGVR